MSDDFATNNDNIDMTIQKLEKLDYYNEGIIEGILKKIIRNVNTSVKGDMIYNGPDLGGTQNTFDIF